jgi:hypothetical protein
MSSFTQTAHYTVWHTADQIGIRAGWLDTLRVPGVVKRDQLFRCGHVRRDAVEDTLAGGCNGGRVVPRDAGIGTGQRRGSIVPGAAAGSSGYRPT